MKPPSFDLLVAESLAEVFEHLGKGDGDEKIMAGGQSLMPMLNMRLVNPTLIVDISNIGELSYIRRDGDFVEVGAATTQHELLGWPELARTVPLLAKAMPHIGHFQTRYRGTVCGSLCHADPSSELPLSLATLEGEVVLRRKRGRRVVKAADFQTGMLSNACEPGEMVVAARFPVAQAGQGFSFHEIARRHGDFAVLALAAVASAGAVSLGVGGLADTPQVRRLTALGEGDLDRDLNDFAWELGGSDDIHASARYRREMVRRIGKKVVLEALHAADTQA